MSLKEEITEPKRRFPEGYKADPATLAAGRYGTWDMVHIWGPEKTFEYSLRAQGQAALTMSRLYPEVVPYFSAAEIVQKANLKYIDPNRIRELEEETGHDVIAINKALEEVLSPEARPYVNLAKTSADTTQPARALQIKDSLKVIADSVENLRDIALEKSMEWVDVPFMCQTHLYDALPISAGRHFSHYGEMLQSDLNVLKFVYENSMIGKWADATGDHHSAVALGIDGIKLQEEYCKDLGIGYTDAPAQIPGLEFEADVFFVMARTGETLNNIAKYIAWGKSDDVNVFFDKNPKKRKGSSAMPHKDAKGGNPTAEEQVMSVRNYTMGNMSTALANCEFTYARNLAASSNSRINLEDGFKYLDHGIRRLASTVFWLGLNEERSIERIERTHGVTTSQNVMNYLVDSRRVSKPMARSEAHDLMGKLAKEAWKSKTPFVEVLLKNKEVTERIDENTLREITDPFKNMGESKNIVRKAFGKYRKKKTLG
jgi:adenylosuccinate lyase